MCHWRASIRRSNSVGGSGAGCAHAENAEGSFAVHPASSETVSWRTLVVVDQELHPNQTVYVVMDAGAVLDPGGKTFVGLAGRVVNCAVAEQVVVPNDTVPFPAGEASPTTTMVVSFAEPAQLADGNASFRVALRGGAEVLCGKNPMIPKGLQIGHNDCPNAGLNKSRAYMKGNLGFIFCDQLSIGRYSRGVDN